MEFIEVIHARRAVRDYEGIPVERSEIQPLIEVAIQAPSAMNIQPWAFWVSMNRSSIDKFSERAREWLLNNADQNSAEVPVHRMLNDPTNSILHHAPALILVLATSHDAQAIEDCCLAADHLMLAARNAGLGTCWIGLARPWFDLASTKIDLGLPETYSVVAPIVLGHPKAWPESPGRKAAEIHWDG